MGMGYTVVSPMKNPERLSRSLGIFAGKVTVASYNATIVECTAITKFFRPTSNGTTGGFKSGLCSVQVDGPSSNGYICNWNYASAGFKCFSPTGNGIVVNSAVGGASLNYTSGSANVVSATSAVGTLLGTVATEAVTNAAIGDIGFVAIGFI